MTLRKMFLTSAAFCLFTSASWAGKEQLQKVPGKNIHQKVITTTRIAALYEEPDGKIKDYIQSYSIFFKLKSPANFANKTDWTLIGDQNGNPLGWVKNKQMVKDKEFSTYTDWNTRFVLEPKRTETAKFSVALNEGGIAELASKDVPEGNKRLAMIVDAPAKEQGEDTEYPVLIYTGPIGDKDFTALKKEQSILDNLKMEVVFVIESTPGMLLINYFDKVGKKTDALEVTKAIISDTVQELKKNPEVAKSVRFGLVEFQDDVKGRDFVSRVNQDLTNDPGKMESALQRIKLCDQSGDWPEDVLAGLNTAVEKISWDPISLKHIILIGTSSAQLDKKGEGMDQYGNPGISGEGKFYGSPRKKDNPNQGYNTSGLQIRDLINKARPQGGSDTAKDLVTKTFHSVIIGKKFKFQSDDAFNPRDFKGDLTLVQGLKKIMTALAKDLKGGDLKRLFPEEFGQATLEVLENKASDIRKKFVEVNGDIGKLDKNAMETIVDFKNLLQFEYKDEIHYDLGKKQFQEISSNNGNKGYAAEIEPRMESADQVRKELSQKLISAFQALVASKKPSGEKPNAAGNNQFTQGLYNIIGADKNKFKDAETMPGKSPTRDKDGRQTAEKKVLVSKTEITHLASTFDSIFQQFKNKTKKADRQDVSEILKQIKQLIVEAGVGENLSDARLSETTLQDLITDLPLKSDVLRMTAKDIAVMPSDSFKNWLENIEYARKRCRELLDNTDGKQFNAIDSISSAKEFTFLRLSELP